MVRYVELSSGGESEGRSEVVRVEISDPDGLVEVGRADGVAARASMSVEAMTEKIRPVAEGVARSFRGVVDAPDEVQVSFGITFSSEADVIVSRASAEANFQVTLTWRRADEPHESRPTGQLG